MLVCNQDRNRNHLCVFSSKGHQDPLTFTDIISALVSAMSRNHIFIVNRWNIYYHDKDGPRSTFYTPTVEPGDQLIPIIRVAACRWLVDLCSKFDKSAFDNYKNLFEADTLCEALDEHSEMKKGPIYRHEQRPFGRLPKDRSPKRIKTQVSETLTDTLNGGAGSSPGYTIEKEINDILSRADGDGLTDDQINVLVQLGYFR
jgi:hypothetical protein